MQAAAFDYHRAASLDEAIALLRDTEGARAIAGGHSLLPAMKLRVSTPSALVDIGRIPGLDGIEAQDGSIRIGALSTHEAVARSEVVGGSCPLLSETASHIGDPQVRARGTLGGALAHADPAADYPTAVLALDGQISTAGPDGQREIDAADFFVDIFTTSLGSAELVTALTVAADPPETGSAYLKHRHPASSYAVVGVAARVTMNGGVCADVRLAVGGVVGRPVMASGAAAALNGIEPTDSAIAAAADEVPAALDGAIGDLYASGEFRVHLAKVLAKRALTAAAARAG